MIVINNMGEPFLEINWRHYHLNLMKLYGKE